MATRKYLHKEQRKALRNLKPQSSRKALTVDVLISRFNHISKNPQDTDAVERYGQQMVSAFKKDSGETQRLTKLLETQTEELLSCARSTDSAVLQELYAKFKKLGSDLNKQK